jgi:hypothetical protein
MAAMNEAFANGKAAHNIGNFDATQFIVSEKNGEPLVSIKKKEEDNIPVTLEEESTFDQGIKWMFLCTAAGHIGDDVFLLSDSTMGEEDFQYVRIRGLTHTCNPAASGWLCFCKTRCGNEKFFKWYITEVLVNFVEDVRHLLPDDMKDVCMYIVADGEEVQVKPIENDDVDAILFQHKIDIGKGPASCTGTVGNACDRSHLFKASKKVLKCINSINKSDFEEPILEVSVNQSISELRPKLTVAKRSFISKGVVKVVRSLGKVVNPQIVMHGFERIGVYPLNHKKCISNCDKSILETFDAEDIDNMVAKIPELSNHFLDEWWTNHRSPDGCSRNTSY